jgi:transcriptional regulator with XRE-family HTH domain
MSDYESQLESVGERVRKLRLSQDLSQKALADRAGVGVATVSRFEKTGSVSLENALRVALALRAETAFDQLFAAPEFTSLDEALASEKSHGRQRASRRS